MTETVQLSELLGAIRERAIVYMAAFREIRARHGEAEAVRIMQAVSRTHGEVIGQEMTHLAADDFQGLCTCWAMTPAGGRVYQPDIRRLDDSGVEFKMMACPIKDAWAEAGCSDEEICTLLRCATTYDRTALETAGFACEIETWAPGKEGCCLTRVRGRS